MSPSQEVIEAFVDWFHKEENFKKSYSGLVQKSVLRGWDLSFFKNKIFDIDATSYDRTIIKINGLIDNNDEWQNYSESSSRGAPNAVLGRNNYQKFLEELFADSQSLVYQRIKLPNESFSIGRLFSYNKQCGLYYDNEIILRFVTSLITKPFVILTGLSGSGKTKLAQTFVQWICEQRDVAVEASENGAGSAVLSQKVSDQYLIVPVGSDWTNREPLLGFPNALTNSDYVLPDSGVLQLMLRAKADPEKPYFLILDEMNLSHVERYFADFLSAMESDEPIPLHSAKENLKPASQNKLNYGEIEEDFEYEIPPNILFPKNLFIIGTVNIDETTHMFSPKVLDRANTIEFRIAPEEMESFLNKKVNPIGPEPQKGSGSSMGPSFLKLYQDRKPAELDPDTKKALNQFFVELSKTGAEFGYRTANEIRILLHQLDKIYESSDTKIDASANGLSSDETENPDSSENTEKPKDSNSNEKLDPDKKLDIAIMQKLLPKLHGSRNKLVTVLKTLAKLCLIEVVFDNDDSKMEAFVNDKFAKDAPESDKKGLIASGKVRYPMSLEKIIRMHRNAIENGFTSFAEA